MRIFILSMVLFLASCSNLSVQDEAIVVTTIKGEESMNDKVYSSQPDMNIDLSKSYTASIKTNLGNIIIELFKDTAPNTVNNFVFLSKDNYYDNVIFHRVISDFMIQGGDPSGTGHGDMGKYPGYKFDDELDSKRPYTKGIVAMANSGPNTNGSQFFITYAPTPHLDNAHAIFGKVMEGMELIEKIPARDPSMINSPAVKIKGIEIREN